MRAGYAIVQTHVVRALLQQAPIRTTPLTGQLLLLHNLQHLAGGCWICLGWHSPMDGVVDCQFATVLMGLHELPQQLAGLTALDHKLPGNPGRVQALLLIMHPAGVVQEER